MLVSADLHLLVSIAVVRTFCRRRIFHSAVSYTCDTVSLAVVIHASRRCRMFRPAVTRVAQRFGQQLYVRFGVAEFDAQLLYVWHGILGGC